MLYSKNLTGPVVLVCKDISFTFPFGYAYLAGYLKEQGENVLVEFRPENPQSYRDFARKLINLKPLLVGFGSIYPDLYHAKDIIKFLDEEGRQFPVVIGGQMVAPIPEFAVEITGADYGVVGEGEIILHELTNALRNNDVPSNVKGLIIRDGKDITTTGVGECIYDLTKLPEIPYELFPEEKWINIGHFYTDKAQPHWRFNDRVVAIHGGRGCPYRCNFCYHHSKPRYRPISQMMEEADRLIHLYDANMLYFGDDLVIASPKRARELVAGIRKLNRPVSYSISCRFNVLDKIDDGLLSEMKETGCRIMGLGIESGSQRILDLMHKKITVDQILTGLRRLKDVGILPTVSIMVGQYTETQEDFQQSMNLMVESVRYNKNIQYAFTLTTPYPGSELYDIAFEKGLLKSHDDFFNKYNPSKDLVGITVNLSNMPDDNIVKNRIKLERAYKIEQLKLHSSNVIKVEYSRKMLKHFDNVLHNKIFDRNHNSAIIGSAEKIYKNIYNSVQTRLDKKRLNLLGLS